MVRGLTWVTLVAILAAGAATPIGGAQHCHSKLNVYGRAELTPLFPPPYASSSQSVCLSLFNESIVDEHTLPPNTGEVYVRVNGDFGPSVQSLLATVDGLGFSNNTVVLQRTSNTFGGFSYNIADWLPLPNGPVDGQLSVTASYPGGSTTVRYHTVLTVVPPEPELP